ncbi:hypothetical protein XENTR_v10017068 [Xenopus tropicalis]|nr:hypothetical protein XENTR_v10017068 [Xenopus tropicalis]
MGICGHEDGKGSCVGIKPSCATLQQPGNASIQRFDKWVYVVMKTARARVLAYGLPVQHCSSLETLASKGMTFYQMVKCGHDVDDILKYKYLCRVFFLLFVILRTLS